MAANDISYEFLQQLTATVIKFNVVITKLDAVSTTVNDNDIFTVAANVGNNQFASKNITYKNFLDTTQEQIRKTPTANVIGKWTFGNKYIDDAPFDNKLLQGTQAIINAWNNNNDNCAVNIEFFKDYAIKSIYDLSNYIYNDPHIPSFIGQVVYSYTLATEQSMKRIYGDHTAWQSISDRFILGTGKNLENTTIKYGELQNNAVDYNLNNVGGEATTILNESAGFPGHVHPFKAQAASGTLHFHFGTGQDEEARNAGHTWFSWEDRHKMKHKYGQRSDWQIEKGNMSTISSTLSGTGRASTASATRASGSFGSPKIKSDIYSETGQLISEQKNHNNMPPSIILYCWERIR